MKTTRFLAILLAALMLAACAFAEAAQPTDPTPETTVTAAPEGVSTTDVGGADAPEDPVVASVGGINIPLSAAQTTFDESYAEYAAYYAQYGMTLSAEEIESLKVQAVTMLAMYAMMDLKIAELGLGEVSDEQKETLRVEAQQLHDDLLASAAEYFATDIGMTPEEAAAQAASAMVYAGYTVDTLYDELLKSYPYNAIFDWIVGDANVTDEAIQAEYDGYVESDRATYAEDIANYEMYTNYYGSEIYYIPEGYRAVKHILLGIPEQILADMIDYETDMSAASDEIAALEAELSAIEVAEEGAEVREPDVIQADIDAAQARYDALIEAYEALRLQIVPALQGTIDEINAKIEAGESFDALIEQYGTDPGMTVEPTKTEGYLVHQDSILWDESFKNAAMALAAVGDVSEPALSDFGVHIIRYVADVPAGPVPMSDAVREALRETLLTAAQEALFGKTMEAWSEEYGLTMDTSLIVMP